MTAGTNDRVQRDVGAYRQGIDRSQEGLVRVEEVNAGRHPATHRLFETADVVPHELLVGRIRFGHQATCYASQHSSCKSAAAMRSRNEYDPPDHRVRVEKHPLSE